MTLQTLLKKEYRKFDLLAAPHVAVYGDYRMASFYLNNDNANDHIELQQRKKSHEIAVFKNGKYYGFFQSAYCGNNSQMVINCIKERARLA